MKENEIYKDHSISFTEFETNNVIEALNYYEDKEDGSKGDEDQPKSSEYTNLDDKAQELNKKNETHDENKEMTTKTIKTTNTKPYCSKLPKKILRIFRSFKKLYRYSSMNTYLISASLLSLGSGITYMTAFKETFKLHFGYSDLLADNLFSIGVGFCSIVGFALNKLLNSLGEKPLLVISSMLLGLMNFFIIVLLNIKGISNFSKIINFLYIILFIFVFCSMNFLSGVSFYMSLRAARNFANLKHRSKIMGILSGFYGISIMGMNFVWKLVGDRTSLFFFSLLILDMVTSLSCYYFYAPPKKKKRLNKLVNIRGPVLTLKKGESGKNVRRTQKGRSEISRSALVNSIVSMNKKSSTKQRIPFERLESSVIVSTSGLMEMIAEESKLSFIQSFGSEKGKEFSALSAKIKGKASIVSSIQSETIDKESINKQAAPENTRKEEALKEDSKKNKNNPDAKKERSNQKSKGSAPTFLQEALSFNGLVCLLTVFFFIGVQKTLYNICDSLAALITSDPSKRRDLQTKYGIVMGFGSTIMRLFGGFLLDYMFGKQLVYSPFPFVIFYCLLVSISSLITAFFPVFMVRSMLLQFSYGVSGGLYGIKPVVFALIFSFERFSSMLGLAELSSAFATLLFGNLKIVAKYFGGPRKWINVYFGFFALVIFVLAVLNFQVKRRFNDDFLHKN